MALFWRSMQLDRSPHLDKLRLLFAQLTDPLWMDQPERWLWRRPDGAPQGPALITQRSPGMANLMWLSLDMAQPPRDYDAIRNPLFLQIATSAGSARLAGEPLLDVAALVPLARFAAMLSQAPLSAHALEAAYPLLRILAERRLRDAHP